MGAADRPSRASGLVDDLGYFHPDVATTRRLAHPEAVEAELRAQIETAYAAGIDVTHLDAHMGCALSPEFCDIYIRLGLEYRLPILLTSTIAAYTPNDNLVGVTEEAHGRGVDKARAAGFEIFDAALQTTWGRPRSKPAEPAYQGDHRKREGRPHLPLPAFQRAGRTGADRAALGLYPHRGIRRLPQRGFSRPGCWRRISTSSA